MLETIQIGYRFGSFACKHRAAFNTSVCIAGLLSRPKQSAIRNEGRGYCSFACQFDGTALKTPVKKERPSSVLFSKSQRRYLFSTTALSLEQNRRCCRRQLPFNSQRRQKNLECFRDVSTQRRRNSSMSSFNCMLKTHTAFVALGSNVGDRVDMIEQACKKMEEHAEIQLTRTSCLWETEPMYIVDQHKFLNAICEVSDASPYIFSF